MKKIIEKTNDSSVRDPYVIKYGGKYYRCYSKKGEDIWVSVSERMDFEGEEEKCVFQPSENKEYSKQIWAPELHIIDNKCYIYVACDDGENHNHRMYVLENNSDDPTQPYVMHGKIADSTDKWAIDGNIMKYGRELYFIWSGWQGDENVCQGLYIAKMKNPYELDSERVLISTPEYEWEKYGATGEPESPFVNEGAFHFTYGGRNFVAYSASGSWCEKYCIAMLELTGDNPLDPESWKKYDKPILCENSLVKGAGHCSVICEDEKINVFFHGWTKDEEEVKWNTVCVWQGIMKISSKEFSIE